MNIGFGQVMPAFKIILDAMFHRGELATLELVEARDHAFATVIAGIGAAALVLLGGFTATFTLAALVWDRSDRGLILGVASVVYFLGAGLLVWLAARRIRGWKPMAETCRQLRQDQLCLESLLSNASSRN